MTERLCWASELYIFSDMVDTAFSGIKTAVILVKSGQRENLAHGQLKQTNLGGY